MNQGKPRITNGNIQLFLKSKLDKIEQFISETNHETNQN